MKIATAKRHINSSNELKIIGLFLIPVSHFINKVIIKKKRSKHDSTIFVNLKLVIELFSNMILEKTLKKLVRESLLHVLFQTYVGSAVKFNFCIKARHWIIRQFFYIRKYPIFKV